MTRYVAFLRAINVGGRTVRMETLKASFVRLGFEDVTTFIASGNVLFSSSGRDTGRMERRISARLKDDLGYDVDTFVRTAAEVMALADCRPFSRKETTTAAALNIGFLAEPLSPTARQALKQLATPIDVFDTTGREWFWLCRTRQSESLRSNVSVEKALKVRSTVRGMNTIVRLARVLAGLPAARTSRRQP